MTPVPVTLTAPDDFIFIIVNGRIVSIDLTDVGMTKMQAVGWCQAAPCTVTPVGLNTVIISPMTLRERES